MSCYWQGRAAAILHAGHETQRGHAVQRLTGLEADAMAAVEVQSNGWLLSNSGKKKQKKSKKYKMHAVEPELAAQVACPMEVEAVAEMSPPEKSGDSELLVHYSWNACG